MNAPNDDETTAAIRRQLTALTDRLDSLRARYDVLMNAFKFEEARAVQSQIETAEREHSDLAAALPAPVSPSRTPATYRVATRRRQRSASAILRRR
jgi:hypothetical protein